MKKGLIIYIVIGVIILAGISTLLFYTKNCNTNQECFSAKATTCSRASLIYQVDSNDYEYTIKGKKSDNCMIDITLTELKGIESEAVKNYLEGKKMRCAVPQTLLENTNIFEIDDLGSYCTGPLKEAILQITADRLYELVVQNFGPVALNYEKLAAVN